MELKNISKNIKFDISSGIVVWLVALPLCLGIALASGAPLFSGLIAGIVGGIIVGNLSGSHVAVSGPAAGLTVIVIGGIATLGSFQSFILAVFIAGALQLIFGFLRAGLIGNFFPSSVIKGMLAAIGLILILKQVPYALGYDGDFAGEIAFVQSDGGNTFSEIFTALNYLSPGAIIISVISIGLLILWEKPAIKSYRFFSILPGPLAVVLLGVLLNETFKQLAPSLMIAEDHLVELPVFSGFSDFTQQLMLPDFSGILSQDVWIVAITIAIVASLETLLSIDAGDKLDKFLRKTPLNRELKAQGIGNMISGLLGGLPITAVIVRTSANVESGARSKNSAILHGILLLATVLLIPHLLNMIPLASLAAVLLLVGYKLTKPSLVKGMWDKGWSQFLPFVITVLAILFTDLLVGITIGLVVGIYFVIKTNFHEASFVVHDNGNYLVRLTKDVSFLNKAILRKQLEAIPDGSYVILDGARSRFIDSDIMEAIDDFCRVASHRNITVETKKSVSAANHYFRAA